MTNKITFSVIIPTYNRPELLTRALNSIRRQSAHGIEVIVVNDGSQKSYDNVLGEYDDLIAHYVSHSTSRGVSCARNTGINLANGEWLIFLDDDDEFYPNYFLKLSEKIASLEENKETFLWANVRIVHFDEFEIVKEVEVIDFSKKMRSHKQALVSASSAAVGYGFAVHISLFRRYGGFDESFQQGEDTELIIRFLKNNVKPAVVSAIGVVKYNHHAGRLSSSSTSYSKNGIYERIIELHKDFLEKNKLLYSSLLQYSAYIHYDNSEFDLGNRALFATLKLPLLSIINALRFVFLLKVRQEKMNSTSR